jgi:hypothetical protein
MAFIIDGKFNINNSINLREVRESYGISDFIFKIDLSESILNFIS